jgi:hypothetical protein
MMSRRSVWPLFVLAAMLALPQSVQGGSLGRAVLRGAARSVAGGARQSTVRRALRADWLRDRRTAVRPLRQPRTVFRYTTRRQMQRELRRGIAPGRHMTSRARPGRPLTADRAARRYGLPAKPEVREAVRLNPGQPARLNRALAGERGRGELTSPRRVPAEAIRRVVPLR